MFLYFLIFGKHGGWMIVSFPEFVGEWILFYCPIVFTLICVSGFTREYYKNKRKNWFWFFVLSLSYLPIVIFISASYHLPAH